MKHWGAMSDLVGTVLGRGLQGSLLRTTFASALRSIRCWLLRAAAGGAIVKPAADTSWGGYAGYFADPDEYLWEVAWGAFEFNADGSLRVT